MEATYITQFGEAIIKKANEWLLNDCHETVMTGENGSNKVICTTGNHVGENPIKWVNGTSAGEFWCAAFAYQVIHEVCEDYGLPVPFADIKKGLGAVRKWRDAKWGLYGITIDHEPAIGSVALRIGAKDNSGHAMIVVDFYGKEGKEWIQTIEGNSNHKVSMCQYTQSKENWKKWYFVHTENVIPDMAGMKEYKDFASAVRDVTPAIDPNTGSAFSWENLLSFDPIIINDDDPQSGEHTENDSQSGENYTVYYQEWA